MSETDSPAWYQKGEIVFVLALIAVVVMSQFVWDRDHREAQRPQAVALWAGKLEQPVFGNPSL